MLTEREIELAHPDAFDFAFGNLPQVKKAEFTRHLSGCRHCQKVIDEYSASAGSSRSFLLTSSRQPTLKNERSPKW